MYLQEYYPVSHELVEGLLGFQVGAEAAPSEVPTLVSVHPNWVTVKQLAREFQDQERQEDAELRKEGIKVNSVNHYGKYVGYLYKTNIVVFTILSLLNKPNTASLAPLLTS